MIAPTESGSLDFGVTALEGKLAPTAPVAYRRPDSEHLIASEANTRRLEADFTFDGQVRREVAVRAGVAIPHNKIERRWKAEGPKDSRELDVTKWWGR